MRKFKEHFWRKAIFASMLTGLFAAQASAQFNPPVAYEDTYVTSPNIGLTGHTSAYSWEHCHTMMYGHVHLALAGWDDASAAQPAGVSWRLLQPMVPSTIIAQGIIPYSNVRDVEVGFLNAGGDPQILVAYYDNGVGHKVDVYSINTGAPVFLYTNVLSVMPNYTRISIDCHLDYAVAIAWEDVAGINTVVGLNNNPITFSGVLTLNGTSGETNVDLAFSHSGLLNVQYVYYNPTTGNMTESAYDFWTAIWLGGGGIIPTVNDVNPVGICSAAGGGGPIDDRKPPHISQCPYPNIDCPGHYGMDNWAYTYTTNNSDISVRLIDYNLSPLASTKIVNNASLWPQMPTSGNLNIHPFCAYDKHCGIRVGWYTNAPDPNTGAAAGYIALDMDFSGLALLSAPDYLTVANSPWAASPTPVLSMSKQDDMFPFLYTVFPEVDPTGGGFQLQHKYPNFCSFSYKGGGPSNTVACNDADKIAAFNNARGISPAISAHPNPFANSLVLTLPAEYQEDNAALVVTNILGVVAGRYSGPAANASGYLTTLGEELAPGTYLLTVDIEGKTRETLKIVKTR